LEISPLQIQLIIIGLFTLLVSIALHEFGHAFMAHRLGDDTPQRQGRVTLNPIAHADPIGTLLLPVLGALHGAASGGGGGGFGWGKPVQWQPHRIRRGISMATANILVSFAGPAMNLLLALVVVLAHAILVWTGQLDTWGMGVAHYVYEKTITIEFILGYVVGTNFVLFFFNLLPVPPLDGGHIAGAFMPYRYRNQYESLARFGPFVVLGFMLIPPFQKVFLIPAGWCTEHLYRLFGIY
jgi:Zn-dependent protease